MRKIEYKDRDTLADEYIKIFDKLVEKQTKWTELLGEMEKKHIIKQGDFDSDIKKIIKADFRTLAKIYLKYISLGVDAKMEKKLKNLFNYKTNQPKIAKFFMQHKDDLDLSTCYYCDMSYVNSYGLDISDEATLLDFLNTASEQMLHQRLGGNKKTPISIVSKRDERKFVDAKDFESRGVYFKPKFNNMLKKFANEEKNHFDLDHVLNKSSCPIVALSLFNFVPSCQVCNGKLKGSKVLGIKDIDEMCLFSPTCDDYKFDESVSITVAPLTPTTSYVDNKNDYSIEFDCSREKKYEEEVDFFKLKDRYNYHKIEALRLMDLKQRFTDTHIKEIAKLVYGNDDEKTIRQTKDDIFQYYFKQKYHRTFSKMYKDILS
ncbi:hypothetical protein [Xylanibacter oryzae]|uniref:hypothetical protein n=1 Tax=Xylanibacter oryzae TaxID=185293 RepID=UPI0004B3172B|nr:hypothetical protein [Xylanibacter oryzae]